MGNYALMLVAGAALAAGLFMTSLGSNVQMADRERDLRVTKLLARDAAVAGAHVTMRALAEAENPWMDPTDYEVTDLYWGTSTVNTVVTNVGSPPGDTVDVIATGTRHYIDRHGFGKDTTHTIQMRVVRYANPGVPIAFRNAITVDLQLQLFGNMYVGSLDPTLNGNVHTNGHLTTTGNSFLVEGYGTYTTSEDVKQPDRFQPNNDINGPDPNVHWADSIKIPDLDLAQLAATATVHETGNLLIDGDTFPYKSFAEWAAAIGSPTGYGTEADPFILLVDGTLTFTNRVELDGFGIVASLTDIQIIPNGTGGGLIGGIFGGTYSELGIYTPGFIDIAGNAEIVGYLYAKNYIQFHGTPSVTGGLVTHDARFNAGGDPNVVHATIKIGNGFDIRTRIIGPRIIAYAEW